MLAIVTTDALCLADPAALKHPPTLLPTSKALPVPCRASTWSQHLYLASSSSIHKYSPHEASLHQVYTSTEDITSIVAKHTGNAIIFAAANRVHVLESDRVSQMLESHKSPITALSLSNDSTLLASATTSAVHVHNLSLLSHTVLRGLPPARITACTFHPHARTRLLLCVGTQVMVYDTTKPSGPIKTVQIGDSCNGEMVAIACSPFSKTLVATATSGGDVALIDLDKEKGLFKAVNVKTPLTSLAFTPEGAAIYLGTENGKLLILDLRTLDKPPKAVTVSENGSRIETMCVHRKSKPSASEPKSKPTSLSEGKPTDSAPKSKLVPNPSRPTPDPETAYLFGGAPRRPSGNPISPSPLRSSNLNLKSPLSQSRNPFNPNSQSSSTVNMRSPRPSNPTSPNVLVRERSKAGSIGAGVKSPARVAVATKLRTGVAVTPKKATGVTPKKIAPVPARNTKAGSGERGIFSPVRTNAFSPAHGNIDPDLGNVSVHLNVPKKDDGLFGAHMKNQARKHAPADENTRPGPSLSSARQTESISAHMVAGSRSRKISSAGSNLGDGNAKTVLRSASSASRAASTISRPRTASTMSQAAPANKRKPRYDADNGDDEGDDRTDSLSSPDLPMPSPDPTTPLSRAKATSPRKAKAVSPSRTRTNVVASTKGVVAPADTQTRTGPGVLGLDTSEVARWVRQGKEKQKDEGGEDMGKRARFMGQDDGSDNEGVDRDDEDALERERELSMQVSPRRPTATNHINTYGPSPWLDTHPHEPSPPHNQAHDLLRSIIKDVVYDFRREAKADAMELHLDLVRLGRVVRGELGAVREEMVALRGGGRQQGYGEMDRERELVLLREENRRLREENRHLRTMKCGE
ncbi:WD40 repeat-like protein [Leucogyrophana mollusca]|uniref:WD40 repeat-like protein n=1 Tax=Leucogyrophana mollusca TaxID=85980 RepID=A0ACB8B8Z3_9AGAM|nr:WD40 repeat-like protein [Leucogyrophana mollusca]